MKELQRERLDEIKNDILESKKIISKNIIHIGLKLIEVKEHLEGKSFDEWVKSEVNFSRSTAYNFIKTAKEFDENTVQTLGQSKVFELLKIEKTKRDDVIKKEHNIDGKKKKVEEMSVREFKKVVSESIKTEKVEMKKGYEELFDDGVKIEREIRELEKKREEIEKLKIKEAEKLESVYTAEFVEGEGIVVYRIVDKTKEKIGYIAEAWLDYADDEAFIVERTESAFAYSKITDFEIGKIKAVVLQCYKDVVKLKEKQKEDQVKEDNNKMNEFQKQFDDILKPVVDEIIKAGYRAMSKKYHPDIIHDNGDKMLALNTAKKFIEMKTKSLI